MNNKYSTPDQGPASPTGASSLRAGVYDDHG